MRKKPSLLNHITASRKDVFSFISHIEAASLPSEGDKLYKIIKAYKDKINKQFSSLEEEWEELSKEYQDTIDRKNQKINALKKDNETVSSNNYLLEYKKKDLMLLADQLEEAYEKISEKNIELTRQKKQIEQQAEKINESNKQILKKNDELEQQKGFILDQAEYLEDANERLQNMHGEVEKQKEEILEKNKELIELNNEKNNLIHIVSHDLKSPLNQIKGLISIIKTSGDNLSEDTSQCLGMMDKSANRLSEMIEKILDVEAIEAKNLNVKLEQTNLSLIAKDCLERYQLTANEKKICLIEEIEADVFAQVDKDFTNQIFENLLSNALKFSQSNTTVQLRLLKESGNALIEIKDEGPGIREEDRQKMFRKFQKLSARPTANETSSGLGLSIVKQFAEAMEGTIWYESEPGKGTSFFVKFKATNLTPSPEEPCEQSPVS